jgi:hypothetical protein
MSRGAKEKFTQERKERSKSGGGPAPQKPTQAEENIEISFPFPRDL